jgi:hypothetical protein
MGEARARLEAAQTGRQDACPTRPARLGRLGRKRGAKVEVSAFQRGDFH